MARNSWRENENAWDGFDTRASVYNEKEEKRYEGTIWKYLAMVALVLLGLIIYIHSKELHIINKGKSITASYSVDSKGNEIVKYCDENDKLYLYNISGLSVEHDENLIQLYYLDNVKDAIPKTKWQLWLMYYLVFGTMLSISVWRLRKVYKKQ